jgi:hypothetical protein
MGRKGRHLSAEHKRKIAEGRARNLARRRAMNTVENGKDLIGTQVNPIPSSVKMPSMARMVRRTTEILYENGRTVVDVETFPLSQENK